jgi:hypothetical protein
MTVRFPCFSEGTRWRGHCHVAYAMWPHPLLQPSVLIYYHEHVLSCETNEKITEDDNTCPPAASVCAALFCQHWLRRECRAHRGRFARSALCGNMRWCASMPHHPLPTQSEWRSTCAQYLAGPRSRWAALLATGCLQKSAHQEARLVDALSSALRFRQRPISDRGVKSCIQCLTPFRIAVEQETSAQEAAWRALVRRRRCNKAARKCDPQERSALGDVVRVGRIAGEGLDCGHALQCMYAP